MSHRVAIVTDSNSGISQKEAKELGIYAIPMPFFVNEKIYFEDIDLTQPQFYQMLAEDANVSTSQPSPGDILDLWEDLLRRYKEVLHIPMSSGLSASCSTAQGLAREFGEKVQVVDNQRVSVTMQQSVMEAIALAKERKIRKRNKRNFRKRSQGIQYLSCSRYVKILKKGWTDHTSSSHDRFCSESEAYFTDSGRKAGRL